MEEQQHYQQYYQQPSSHPVYTQRQQGQRQGHTQRHPSTPPHTDEKQQLITSTTTTTTQHRQTHRLSLICITAALALLVLILLLLSLLRPGSSFSSSSQFPLPSSSVGENNPSDTTTTITSTTITTTTGEADVSDLSMFVTSSLPAASSFLHSPPSSLPPPHSFTWCYDCPDRCENILSAIQYHTLNISHRDRAYKYREIAASLPRFFRGLDHLYLQDVFNIPQDSVFWRYSTNRTRTFIDADMHMFNFGSFQNSKNELVYDMNDFDQTFIGDYHVDLWRTSTSIVIHMDVNNIYREIDRQQILRSFALTYIRAVKRFVGNNNELSMYINRTTAQGPVKDLIQDMARNNNRLSMLEEYCYFDRHGIRRLDLSRPDMEPVSERVVNEINQHWSEYLQTLGQCRRIHRTSSSNPAILPDPWISSNQAANVSLAAYYTIKSIAARVGAGLGSLGQPRYYILIEGPSNSQNDDIMLDVKREPTPEWWNFVHQDVREVNSHFSSEGHRICLAIHALQINVEHDVGYMEMEDGSYIVRARSPWKGAVNIDALVDVAEYQSLTDQLALITAINHCRGDDDFSPIYIPYSFESALSQVIGDDEEGFATELVSYAYMNAHRIAKDFQCYVRSGLAENP